jgi:hypothetical protein
VPPVQRVAELLLRGRVLVEVGEDSSSQRLRQLSMQEV